MINSPEVFLLSIFQQDEAIVYATKQLLTHPASSLIDKSFCDIFLENSLETGERVLGGMCINCEGNKFIGVQGFFKEDAYGCIKCFANILWGDEVVFAFADYENGQSYVTYSDKTSGWRRDFSRLYNMYYR